MEDLWKTIQERGPKGDFHDILKSYPPEGFMDHWKGREYFTKNLAWAVPSIKAIQKIKEFVDGMRVLEVGSGLGLWARLLQDEGVDITPTDSSPKRKQYFQNTSTFTTVHDLTHVQALKKYPNHEVLMLCWPPYSESMALEALHAFKGYKIVYIGETGGGCCATEDFWEELESKYKRVDDFDIPQWYGLHDYMVLFHSPEYNPPPKKNRKIEC